MNCDSSGEAMSIGKLGLNTKWYAIYTRPRWEKKVDLLLKEQGLESYCPLNKVRRKWSDRIKMVEEPLFKSYVFVRTDDKGKAIVRLTGGVINFVYWNGKPAIVKDKEIISIRRFLDEYENVQAIDLKPHQRIIVTSGPFMDLEGKVLELRNKVARVAIDSLGFVLVANIDKSKLSSAPPAAE